MTDRRTDRQTAGEVARPWGARRSYAAQLCPPSCHREIAINILPMFRAIFQALYQVNSSDPGKMPTPLSSLSRLAHGEPRAGLYRDEGTLTTPSGFVSGAFEGSTCGEDVLSRGWLSGRVSDGRDGAKALLPANSSLRARAAESKPGET